MEKAWEKQHQLLGLSVMDRSPPGRQLMGQGSCAVNFKSAYIDLELCESFRFEREKSTFTKHV